jgi:hypothetical protein
MAKLEDLFIERQESLYDNSKYPYKKDGDSQPYVYTRVTESESVNPMFENRVNPVSLSARKDFKRMFEFSKSPQGLIFLGKQTFLQTGNTFDNTRIYNPLNVQIHSVPFVHRPRHIESKKILELFNFETGEKSQLQKSTIQELKLRNDSSTDRGSILNFSNTSFESNTRPDEDRYVVLQKKISGTKPWKYYTTGDVGQSSLGLHLFSFKDKQTYSYFYKNKDANPKGFLNYIFNNDTLHSTLEKSIENWTDKNDKYIQEVQNYLGKVEDADGNLIKGGRDGGKNISIASPGTPEDGKFVAKSKEGGDVTTADSRYYKDLTQIDKSIFKRNIPFIYDVDSVDVIFEAGEPADLLSGVESPAVRFRALIEDINESVTPVYNENKYIGRYETFYTYNKVTRDLSFSLTLHAFSAEELDHIHYKMSYLTSLAYPETTGNYLTPNIFKVTIGLVYHKQPCILQSLTHTIESDTSWDIDRQRPMTIKANIGLRLLDKKAHYILEPSIYGREILEWDLEGNVLEQGTR